MKDKENISMKEMLTKRSFEPITNCNCSNNEEIAKSCKNCVCNEVCDKKLDLKYFFDNHDCEHYQPKLPKDSVSTSQEEVLDILNKLEFFQGQRAGRELWNDKPKEVQDQDIADFVKGINYIRSYLKNSVVLSKEEYDELSTIGKRIDDQTISKIITETAEKFARDIFNHITTPEVWEKLRMTWFNIDGNFITNKHIYDLLIEPVAKTFGIEIKE